MLRTMGSRKNISNGRRYFVVRRCKPCEKPTTIITHVTLNSARLILGFLTSFGPQISGSSPVWRRRLASRSIKIVDRDSGIQKCTACTVTPKMSCIQMFQRHVRNAAIGAPTCSRDQYSLSTIEHMAQAEIVCILRVLPSYQHISR